MPCQTPPGYDLSDARGPFYVRTPSVGQCRPTVRRRGGTSIALAASFLVLTMGGPLRADLFTPSVQDQIKLGDQAAAQVIRS